jgi:alanine racemase
VIETAQRRAEARIDLDAIERNCRRLGGELRDGTELCAVVKADGYGHGAVECAQAAIAGGASMLAVAATWEAMELRAELPDARILTLGALSSLEVGLALEVDTDVAAWTPGFVDQLGALAEAGARRPRVHVKHDSGMGRLGESDPERVLALLDRVAADERLELTGLWTHFATADEVGDSFFGEQLERFAAVAERALVSHPGLLVHAANSAATLREPDSHFGMVRCGVAIYGLDPFGEDPAARNLEPALELRSYVAAVKAFSPGMSAGYGRTWFAERETSVGVLPIGYGDGVRRGLSNNAEVLVGGERRPLVGTVSMDNVTVDLGAGASVEPGAPAVLIGAQAGERILCEELARRLDTINYEITCGISPRVPRVWLGGQG